MKILMTGGFGNVGAHALRHAVNRGYDVTVFDVQNERNQKVQAKLSAELRFNTQWGDLPSQECARCDKRRATRCHRTYRGNHRAHSICYS
jgi:nucleoside-diphosphate-sugar epimerase